jgi:Fe2+ or Zn2+ uptake regulation protein
MAETITDPLAREVLRVLCDAHGPLTAPEVASRIGRRHGGCLPTLTAGAVLRTLGKAGLVESRADAGLGITAARSRIFWPVR